MTALTQLRSLYLGATPFAIDAEPQDLELFEGWEREQLAPALAALTRLTSLRVEEPPPAAALPPSLSAQRQLRRFGWLGLSPHELRLPAGPWLAGLQQLALPADVAEGSAAEWKKASRLERLRVQDFFGAPGAALPRSRQRLLSDAAALPCLRTLQLGWTGSRAPTAAQAERVAAALRRNRPAVRVEVDAEPDDLFASLDDDELDE